MKITAKQLRRIIREEASSLNEMFTPAGSIGFGDISRRPRSDYHDLTLVDQAYDDLVKEADAASGDEVDEQYNPEGAVGMDPATQLELQVIPRLTKLEEELATLKTALEGLTS